MMDQRGPSRRQGDDDGDGGDDRESYDDYIKRWRNKGIVPPGLAWIVLAPAPTTDACNVFHPHAFISDSEPGQ